MEWSDVLNDPTLSDLPYKIELNEYGSIVMTPASNDHGFRQMDLGKLIVDLMPNGKVLSECSIQCKMEVRVAHVAWCSDEFLSLHGRATPYQEAPEICVEIISPSNSDKELTEKKSLYFAAGAKEVWYCNEQSQVTFHDEAGEIEASRIIPGFPQQI